MASRSIETPIGTLGLVGSDAGLRYVRWSTSGLDLDGGCTVLDDTATTTRRLLRRRPDRLRPPARPQRHRVSAPLLARARDDSLRADGELRRTGAQARARAGLCARSRCRERPESTPARAAVSPRDRSRRIADGLRGRTRVEALPSRARGRAPAARLVGSEAVPSCRTTRPSRSRETSASPSAGCSPAATARRACARRWRNEPSKRDCLRSGS